MAIIAFHEYLDSKGKLKEPKVKTVADEVDVPKDRDTKPPKGQGMGGKQQPYAPDGKGVAKKSEKGFGDQGDSDLQYDVTKNPKGKPLPTAEGSLPVQMKEAILQNPRMLEHLVNELSKANLS